MDVVATSLIAGAVVECVVIGVAAVYRQYPVEFGTMAPEASKAIEDNQQHQIRIRMLRKE